MKIIIAGGRDFNNYKEFSKFCTKVLRPITNREIIIVSGGARGSDKLGEQFALEKGYSIKEFKPNWIKYGKAAGPIRNREMAEYADLLIVFWNGKSRGTKNIIDLCKKKNMPIELFLY